MKELEMTIDGKVQGVGFRAFAKLCAQELGVTGWVRNTENGYVDIVAQGDEESLREFEAKMRKGPAFARVENVDVAWYDEPQDAMTEFTIE